MKLVDHKITELLGGLRHIAPIENILYHPGPVAPASTLSPAALAGYHSCVRIQEHGFLIKNHSFFRRIGSTHPIGVLKLFNVKSEYNHGVDVADFVFLREGQHRIGLLLSLIIEQQFAGGSKMGMHGKAHPIWQGHGPVYIEKPWSYGKACDLPHGRHGYSVFRYKFLCIILQAVPPVFDCFLLFRRLLPVLPFSRRHLFSNTHYYR